MSTISSNQNYVTNNNQPNVTTPATTSTQSVQGKHGHNHHHGSSQSQDSLEISLQGQQDLSASSTTNPLNTLVSNGTITPNQETAIQNAIQAAAQQSTSGTYSNKPSSLLHSLVSNGTITQDQENSIKNSLQAARNSNDNQKTEATNTSDSNEENTNITDVI